jgi:hypothetical protein
MRSEIASDDATLLKMATHFHIGTYQIGRMIATITIFHEVGEWRLRAEIGEMNGWGLDHDGVWKYKKRAYYATPQAAIEALNRSFHAPKWEGYEP